MATAQRSPQLAVAAAPAPPGKPSRLKTLLPITSAALVTAAVMYPVDVLRALKMASASGTGYTIGEFIKIHGLKGVMTQGLVPEITRATWMRILKFFFFPITFELLWGKTSAKGEWYEKGIAGILAVIPEVMTITTLELAKIGLQLDSEKRFNNSTGNLVKYVHSKTGISGLMAGWQGVQFRQSLWTGSYFATLDMFKRKTRDLLFAGKQTADNAGTINFLAGFGAGCFGAAMNTPFDLTRTLLQKQALNDLYSGKQTYTPTQYAFSLTPYFRTMSKVVQERGVMTLYNGFAMKGLHMGGSGACIAYLIPVFAKMFGMSPEGLM